jgi:hypothetical protein
MGHKIKPSGISDLILKLSQWAYDRTRVNPELTPLIGLSDFGKSVIMKRVKIDGELDEYPNLLSFLKGNFSFDSSFSVDHKLLDNPPLNIYAFLTVQLPEKSEDVNFEFVYQVSSTIKRFFSAIFSDPPGCPNELRWSSIFEILNEFLQMPLSRIVDPKYILDKWSRIFYFVFSTFKNPLFVCGVHTAVLDILAFRQFFYDEFSKLKQGRDLTDYEMWSRNANMNKAFICYGSSSKASNPTFVPKSSFPLQYCAKSILETIGVNIGKFKCTDHLPCQRQHLSAIQVFEEKDHLLLMLASLKFGWSSENHKDEAMETLQSFSG